MKEKEALKLAIENLDAFNIFDGDISQVIKVDELFCKGNECTIRFQYPMPDGEVGHLMAMITDGVEVEWG